MYMLLLFVVIMTTLLTITRIIVVHLLLLSSAFIVIVCDVVFPLRNTTMNNEATRKFRGTWAPTLVDSDVRKHEQYQGVPVQKQQRQSRNVAPSIRAKQIALFDEHGAPRPVPLDPERVSAVSNNDQAQTPNVPAQQVNHYEWNNVQQQQQQQVMNQSSYYNASYVQQQQQQQQYNPVPTTSYGSFMYQEQPAIMPQMVQPMYAAPPPSVVGYVHTDLGDDSAVPVLFQYPFM